MLRKKTFKFGLIVVSGLSLALLILFFLPLWLSAPEGFCYGPRLQTPICKDLGPERPEMPRNPELLVPVYIVGHGWHTGLVLRALDIPAGVFGDGFFPDGADSVEIGWGDEGFYRAKEYTGTLAAKALLMPTPSVMHTVFFSGNVEKRFPHSDISLFWIEPDDYLGLLKYVAATFERNPSGQLIDLGPGIYGISKFYRAQGSFHFPKSCNYWVANALQAGGAPIWTSTSITADNTLRQINLFSETVRSVPGLKLLPL